MVPQQGRRRRARSPAQSPAAAAHAAQARARRISLNRTTANRILVAATAFAAVLFVVVGAGAAAAATPPEVGGRPLTEARQLLAEAGIAAVVTVPARPGAAEADALVAGYEAVPLTRGVEAELRVRTQVPSAVGMSLAEATALMSSVGLVACPSDDAGTVLAQASEPGSVLPFGAVVGLTVSGDGGVPKPPVVPVVVPSVLGRSPAVAAALLAETGLVSEQRLRGAGASGPVIDQEPAAGTRVGPGSLITLVSQGERLAPGRSSVPAILGLEVDAATQLLAAAGLVLGVDARPTGLEFDGLGPIREQEPGPGVEVEAGSTVSAVVDALVAVPDLAGFDLDAAAELLASLGLTLVVERESPVLVPGARGPAVGSLVRAVSVPLVASTPTAPPRTERVTGQTPSPGTLVPAGSVIVVTLTGDPPAEPPLSQPVVAPGPLAWWWFVVVAAVLLVTVWTLVMLRGARHGRWVAAHVSATPHPVPAAVVVRPRPGAPPSRGIRVTPVAGPLDDVQVRQVDPE